MKLVLAAFACVSVVALARPAAACAGYKNQARIDARTIHPIAEKYVVDHPGVCPTLELLKAEKEISAASKITDPWDRAYKIRCLGGAVDDVTVISLGCDGIEGTTDDVVVPEPPEAPVRRLPAGRCPASDPRPEPTPALARLLVHVTAGSAGLLAVSLVDEVSFMKELLR
jgi:hypothetical protein